ncbi:Hypothetical_protein [Hexamita inflata]|uniref:Hypothetical_protein n=1 Tax=Hexamita inflata TaxID=28002 RepID=A0AA86NX74_9EUKA|nr:Hypothetical protein HINF_LOCUS14390 [Hexamita inflata]
MIQAGSSCVIGSFIGIVLMNSRTRALHSCLNSCILATVGQSQCASFRSSQLISSTPMATILSVLGSILLSLNLDMLSLFTKNAAVCPQQNMSGCLIGIGFLH